MATRYLRRLRELLDVDTSAATPGDALTLDVDGETWIPGAGGGGSGDAVDIAVTPAGGIASTNVQAALVELDSEKESAAAFADHSARHENGGADEISVAGLSGLLADAQTPDAHVHAGEEITSGTVADARIAATIARDSEVSSAVSAEATARDSAISAAIANLIASAPGALDTLNELAAALGNDPNFATTITNALAGKQPIDSDLTAVAALTTTAYGRSLLELANAAALRTAGGLVIGTDVQAQDSDLSSIAALTTTSYGRALLELANAAALRTAAGLVIGTDVQAQDSDLAAIAALTTTSYGRSLLEAANAGALRTLAGTVIGTDVEAHDADLTTIAGLSPANDDVLQRKAGAWTNRTLAQLLADLGVSGPPDPVFDVLGTPATAFEFSSSSLTGLTAFSNTPDQEAAHTIVPNAYFLRDEDAGGGTVVCGRYAATPAAPFTAVVKILDAASPGGNFPSIYLTLGVATPGAFDAFGLDSASRNVRGERYSAPSTYGSNFVNLGTSAMGPPLYLAVRVNSSSDVDYLYSFGGYVWRKVVDSRNPSLTLGSVGFGAKAEGNAAGGVMFAVDFLRIWNSAKTFPGALA
jgi:hypothetical protein